MNNTNKINKKISTTEGEVIEINEDLELDEEGNEISEIEERLMSIEDKLDSIIIPSNDKWSSFIIIALLVYLIIKLS